MILQSYFVNFLISLCMSNKKLKQNEFDKEVAHTVRDLVTQLNRKLKKQVSNEEQLSIAELNVAKLLVENGRLLPSEICNHFNLSSQYASQVLNRLKALGMITREAAETDKRKNYAVITKKGKKWLQTSRQEREEWLAESIAKKLTVAEKETIVEAAQLLYKACSFGD